MHHTLAFGGIMKHPAVHCRFYWAFDPISYAQKALAINEFSAPRWQNLKTATGESVGNTVLDQRGLPHEQWWIWCVLLIPAVCHLLNMANTRLAC